MSVAAGQSFYAHQVIVPTGHASSVQCVALSVPSAVGFKKASLSLCFLMNCGLLSNVKGCVYSCLTAALCGGTAVRSETWRGQSIAARPGQQSSDVRRSELEDDTRS